IETQLAIPQLPEMLFGNNVLKVVHIAGFGIEFKAVDALERVDTKQESIQVAAAESWQKARSNCEFLNKVIKPFDWTFTTDYKGTVISTGPEMRLSETSECIDIEKLKVREKIHFYEDMTLFEDELADNGTATLGVKIRVMQTGFFLLLRFFLRVDGVLIRINDTRIYHEAGSNYMIREYSSKEKKISELDLKPHELTDPAAVDKLLDVKVQTFERLDFPPETAEIEKAAAATTATAATAAAEPKDG
ncbi:putative TIP41-like protein, partial [Apostichopus japonicus]